MKLKTAGGATRSSPDEGERGPGELAEIALVTAAIVQGLVLGAWLGLFPAAALRAGGPPARPPARPPRPARPRLRLVAAPPTEIRPAGRR